MRPNLDDTSHVAFRLFTMGPHDVSRVKIWDEAPVGRGKAWDRIGDYLQGHGQPGQYPNQQHTELSIKLGGGKTTYVIAFGSDTQTVFGPGNPPITLLPPSMTAKYLSNVGLVYRDASGAPDFMASIPTDFAKLPADAALMFTCDRDELETVWKASFKGHNYAVPLAVPIHLNLYDTTTKLPVWASDMHFHVREVGLQAANFETHGGIHPGDKKASSGGKMDILTHGGIHPSSNVQLLY